MNTVLCYSGGLDSTVLLYHLLSIRDTVKCLGVNYGQRHSRELRAAFEITDRLGVDFQLLDLSGIRHIFKGSSQTDNVPVPEGHYAEESMKLTVVPNRNMLLLSLATAWAISSGCEEVAYAAHSGDHTIYPDCRPEFVEAMRAAVNLCDWKRVGISTPFLSMTKADIARRGAELSVPFQLTWTCYKGGEKHCGKCGSCTERREAFQLAGVQDPTEYLQ